jgi:class 3 adenylate cyclase/Tfp pilus assembly protein PilF
MHNLVPDFIIENFARGQYRGEFQAASLFVDISGFTTITDALMAHGPYGAEVLATIMRRVFKPLIQDVFEQNGIIANFAGDAFTALFPVNQGDQDLLRALAAGWQLQQDMAVLATQSSPFGNFELSAKVGLASGEVTWGIVRSSDRRRAAYYFQGSAVDGCAQAEHCAGSGEIVLTADLYERLRDYLSVEPVEDSYRLKAIGGGLPSPDPVRIPSPALEIQRLFFPQELLLQAFSGEFRQVVNLFIGLPTVRTEAQLDIFMQSLFQLQDRYGGLLNRLDFGDKGSNLLLFWGAPVAFENDVARALHFILELQTRTSIPINAGVTYQIAHAGFIGSDLLEDYTCYGRGVNLAARFMSESQRGEIWLDERAARRARNQFDIEHLGDQTFKGFERKQPVYLLFERREAVESLFQGILVGRENELARLAAFVAPLWQGQFAGALVIWGEPGIGKSRLVFEFKASGTFEEYSALWAVCRTDEITRQSLGPFRYWLHHYFEQSQAQTEARNKRSFNRKLDGLIEAIQPLHSSLAEELDRTRSFLAALLDLRWPDSLYEQLDPQGRYENTLIALTSLLRGESLIQPLILFLEDVQWMDEDSLQFFPQLLRALTSDESISFPVAILANARREGIAHRLAENLSYQEMELDSLPGEAVAQIAEANLEGPVAPRLLSLLFERSQGNPFFAEQIARHLQEEGLLERGHAGWQVRANLDDSVLPVDVRAVLVARLDRLTQEVKEVVQTAAVLGQEFEVRLLSQMLRDDERLLEKVAAAERLAIWTALTELRYLFRHALLRDAAYRMQVRARRQALHALAVESMESLFGEGSSAHFGELSYHSERAGLVEKARAYLRKAGDSAREAYHNNQAIDYFSRALKLTPENDLEGRFILLLAREQLYDLLGARQAQQRDLESLEELARVFERESPDREASRRKSQLSVRWASYFNSTGDYPRALEAARQALEQDAAEHAPEVAVTGYRMWALSLFRQGGFPEAIQMAEIGRELSRTIGDQRGESLLLNLLGLIALERHDPQDAKDCFQQTLELMRAVKDRRGEAQPLNNLGIVAGSQGDFAAAWDFYQQALEIAREIGDRGGEGLVLGNLGWLAKTQGDYASARDYLEQNIRIARETGHRHQEAYAMINLAWLLTALGEYATALEYAEQCLDLNRSTGDRSAEAWGLTCLGHVHFESGRYEEANRAYQAALKIRRDLDQPNLATEPAAGVARVALAGGDQRTAQQYLEEILAYLDGGGKLEGAEEPLRVYLTCYQVLRAMQDPRAEALLSTAYRQLQEQAGRLTDLTARQIFLEQVTCNREILAAWASREQVPPQEGPNPAEAEAG